MPSTLMRAALLAAALIPLWAHAARGAAPDEAGNSAIEGSVVKVFVQSNPPDLLSPWQKAGVEPVTGSGVIIDGERILTAAHVVADAVTIEVKRAGGAKRLPATLVTVGHTCDLALLKVSDPSFFKGVKPPRLGELPAVQQQVRAYGFPVGGETLSVTSGILSRIEINTYSHSMENMLLAQIDAALNEGNSGGPVMADGLAGIAVQALDGSEGVGYMIPVTVVEHFLEDVADGRFDGFPVLGAQFQALESDALRQSLGMEKQAGVLVTRVDYGSPAASVLKPGDVLLSLGGAGIADDGTVELPRMGRVHFSQIYQAKQIGERVAVTALRAGATIQGEMTLGPWRALVPGRRTDEPEYLVFGGVVFRPLTADFLMEFEELPYALADDYLNQNMVTQERSQIIIVQKVLPHETTRGYEDWENAIVATVNGTVPRDMQHLARLIDEAKGPWLSVVDESAGRLTLDLKAARAAQPVILSNFGIAHDRSAGLRAKVRGPDGLAPGERAR